MQKSNTIDQLGRYRLLRTLASNEHLDVFEGVHLGLGRRAAIKALYLYEMRDKRERQRNGGSHRAARHVRGNMRVPVGVLVTGMVVRHASTSEYHPTIGVRWRRTDRVRPQP